MEGIFAGGFALLIAIVLMLTGLRQLKNRAALDRWPTTKGKVIERSTYQPDIPTLGPPAFRHSPLVKYVYRVAEKEFVGDRIRPKRIQQPQHNTKDWAQRTANKFPDEVDVHYNPEDPSESFLVQTPKILLYTLIGGSCVALLFAAMLLLTK
ncbi:MAG TPA: hypothetical protein DC054_19250 [Blastocatellia bacterium]|nr:hypothetical protein [Blastocatellia bacterium]